MPKFIDEVLSEIVGVPCGDITFSLCVESVGQTLGDYYVNAIQRSTIEFKTKVRIESDQIGSDRIRSDQFIYILSVLCNAEV